MKKNISVLFLLFIVLTTYSQQKVFETDNVFLKPTSKKNETFALPDQKNGDVMLIMSGRKSMQGILLDSLYHEKTKINAEPLPNKFKHFLGYSIKQNSYSILFTNDKESKYGVLQFNTNDKSFTEHILKLKLKKELLVQSVVYNNEIFLFTINKRSSDLNIYTFDESFNPKKRTVSLQEVNYPKIPGSSIIYNAYSLLTEKSKSAERRVEGVSKVESKNPNIIETTSKKIKIYQKNNRVIFSFDNNPDKTDLFFINLDTFTLSYKSYDKASKNRNKYKKNNSYLFENKLFQIASSNELMNFKIIDLDTDKVIRDYTVGKEDSITFKNSPIIEEKTGRGLYGITAIDKTKEMEKTSKFLKRISFADLGISVYKVDDLYNVVLGGTKDYDPNAGITAALVVLGGVAMAGAGTVAAPTSAPSATTTYTNFNPTYYNYYYYGATKSTYINCLFDKNFEHKKGQIPLNTFDIINDFEASIEDPRAVNIFIHENRLYYNYLDKKDGSFELYRFEE